MEQVAILALSLAGILTRLVGLGNRVMSHDESLHVYYSWLLAAGRGLLSIGIAISW
jgi:predicted membrane-bound mannosyltransferase